MKTQKPKKLKSGDVIGLISPASSPEDLSRVEKTVAYLEKLGYRVEVGKNVGKYYGYLAGNDEERLQDFHDMFANKKIKAVFCLRGGYGVPRLLSKIDYRLVKNNPKLLIGYSDITALQMALLKKTGLITIAGPMAAVELYKEMPEYSEENFWRLVTSSKKLGKIEIPKDQPLQSVTKGNAKGKIIGGNLAVFVGLMGTEYLPSFNDTILFFEDIGEVPYRVDRFFSQLTLSKAFKKANGLLLGQFTDCEEKDAEKRTLTLSNVFDDYLAKIKIPTISNFPNGHVEIKMPIPYGIEAKVNSEILTVEFLESAVI
ncbi:MAG TPA: LD-carboxypeptidase [Ignavibacteriaceae bacterium]|nr:LD-carboxypeptidase [Ignavibacteriaceae bacterium]